MNLKLWVGRPLAPVPPEFRPSFRFDRVWDRWGFGAGVRHRRRPLLGLSHHRWSRVLVSGSAKSEDCNQRFWRGSGPPEKVSNEFRKPSRGRLGARRGRKLLDDYKAVDPSLQVGVEEGRVVAEGYASVRLAVGTEHVGMCKQPITAEHFAVADWNKADGTNAVERLLAHHEFVGIRRRGPLPLQVDVASIVHVVAEARMRFQPASVRQVDRTRSNVIDRGAAIIVDR